MALAPKGSLESAEDVRSEINVTPLVDVMLVLLIIFMVVTPMLQKGVDVPLPQTGNPPKMPESPRQLEVAIKRDGTYFIGGIRFTKDAVEKQLKDLYATNSERDVTLKADRGMKYKEVRDLMRTINEAGFSDVGLVTQKRGGGS
jgi:biopolymer transport protein TolR